ncbi:MAG: carboxymethylenebutenolidase [Frankiales bacterium]|jgi:carboxymethylenebutenolidase|nr:carboxymethylenebutenolidase [Frankiales bacterium]
MAENTAANPRQNVTFPSNGGEAHGYLATPPSGSGPGVIVIQEWWGLDAHIADIADRLAAEGFVALAPDLYGGTVAHDANEATQLLMSLDAKEAAKDLSGAVDYLLARDEVTSPKLGVIGFCMGGGFVLMLAAERPDQIAAAVPFYGVGPGLEAADLSSIQADVLGHYAEDDAFYPLDDAKQLERRLTDESKGSVKFYYYDGAGHAFHDNENKLGNYNADFANQAWQRTVDFLRATLS